MWLKPLEQWYCDVCGDVVGINGGYVIWRNDSESRYVDFRIIHQGKCDDRRYSHSLPLREFLGETGRTMLMSKLTPGPIKRAQGDQGGIEVANIDEFVDLFRRVQVPYYEQARRHFNDPDIRDQHGDSNEVAPYLPEALKAIIEKIEGAAP